MKLQHLKEFSFKKLGSWLVLVFIIITCNSSAQGLWIPVSGQPNYGQGRLDDVSFINDSVGWTGQNGMLFKTIDKGEHWQLTDTFEAGAYIRSIEFINDTLGFVGTLLGQNAAHLYQTNDGGQTFFLIDSLLPVPHNGICGLAHMGGTVIGAGVYAEPAKFIKSVNYGKTWSVADLSQYASGLVECQMIDSLTYLLGGIGVAPSKNAIILKTTDGGINWQQVAISASNSTYTWKIAMLPSGFGYAAVENFSAASFFKTTDFGSSWVESTIPLVQLSDIGSIGFINDSVGWVGRQHGPGMAKTSDGGATWTYVSVGQSINRIIQLDSSLLIGCGLLMYKNNLLTSVDHTPAQENVAFHQLFFAPNPCDHSLKITIDIEETTFAVLDLLDGNGSFIRPLFKGKLNKGVHTFEAATSNLKDGNYFLLFRSNEGHLGKAFIVNHPSK